MEVAADLGESQGYVSLALGEVPLLGRQYCSVLWTLSVLIRSASGDLRSIGFGMQKGLLSCSASYGWDGVGFVWDMETRRHIRLCAEGGNIRYPTFGYSSYLIWERTDKPETNIVVRKPCSNESSLRSTTHRQVY